MFKAKRIEIDASNDLVMMLNEEDAKNLSLNAKDRVKIINTYNEKSIICVLDIIEEQKGQNTTKDINLKKGEIGIFEKAFDKLELKENQTVLISPAQKPKSLDHIKRKFNEKIKLSKEQFKEILTDIVENRYSQVETTYFVLACSVNELTDKETIDLTEAMVDVGKVLNFKSKPSDIVVDKHCIGGLAGNRTSMVIVPILAAAGLTIPKTSSRAITSPAGTADTMEVLTNVEIPLTQMFNQVQELKGCIVWGGGLELSPADDLIIQVEHPLQIDSEGQMLASILSKKKSVGSTHVLIDIPVGPTAKVNTLEHAKHLKKKFEKIGKAIGLTIKVIITDGRQPIGNGIGPLYEALDVLKVLKNTSDAPQDLLEKSLQMSGEILEMANKASKGKGYDLAKAILESKAALTKFEKIIEAQGKKKIPAKAKYSYEIKSNKDTRVLAIDNKKISKLAFMLGAPQDKVAGLILKKKIGEQVREGETIYEIYTNSELKLKYAKTYLEDNIIYNLR